ncbi:hypothetical protein PybrP1_006274 [[Pythium] brassicae (nom. inval.)]|nr:hypothetical protein PybrP1_006274 [[Pythium] brassicae (nom. inval.)]
MNDTHQLYSSSRPARSLLSSPNDEDWRLGGWLRRRRFALLLGRARRRRDLLHEARALVIHLALEVPQAREVEADAVLLVDELPAQALPEQLEFVEELLAVADCRVVQLEQVQQDVAAKLNLEVARNELQQQPDELLDVLERQHDQRLLHLVGPHTTQRVQHILERRVAQQQDVRRARRESGRLGVLGFLRRPLFVLGDRRELGVGQLDRLHQALAGLDRLDRALGRGRGRAAALGVLALAGLAAVRGKALAAKRRRAAAALAQLVLEELLHLLLALLLEKDLVLGAHVLDERPVLRAAHHEAAVRAHGEPPDLAKVLLVDLEDALKVVAVPVRDALVLRGREEVVRLLHKAYAHDAVLVRKDRLVAVAKVEAPELDVLVRRRGHDHRVVRRNVHRHDRELVPVEAYKELERVVVEDLDRAVQQRDRHHELLGVPRVAKAHAEHVIRHLEQPRVAQPEPEPVRALDAVHLKVPKVHVLVGAARDDPAAVRTHVDRPHGAAVVRARLLPDALARVEVEEQELAGLGAHNDVHVARRERGREREAQAVVQRADALQRARVPDLHSRVRQRQQQLVVRADRDRAHVRAVAAERDRVRLGAARVGVGSARRQRVRLDAVVLEPREQRRRPVLGHVRRERERLDLVRRPHDAQQLELVGRRVLLLVVVLRVLCCLLQLLLDLLLLLLLLLLLARPNGGRRLGHLLLLGLLAPTLFAALLLLPDLVLRAQLVDLDRLARALHADEVPAHVVRDAHGAVVALAPDRAEQREHRAVAVGVAHAPDAQLVVRCARDEAIARGVHVQRPHLAAVADARLHAVLRVEVPHLEQRVLGRGHEPRVALAHKAQRRDGVLVALEAEEPGLAHEVPHNHVSVARTRREHRGAAARAERERLHGTRVAVERDLERAGGQAEDAHGACGVAGRHERAVGAQRQRRRLPPIATQCAHERALAHVPDDHVLERRGDRQPPGAVEDHVACCRCDHAERGLALVAQVRLDHLARKWRFGGMVEMCTTSHCELDFISW